MVNIKTVNQKTCAFHDCERVLDEQDKIYIEKRKDTYPPETSIYTNAYCSQQCRETQIRENKKEIKGFEPQSPLKSITVSTNKVNFE